MTSSRPRHSKLTAAVATALALLAVGVLASSAAADVKTFSPPIKKTRHALVFKIAGVNPDAVLKASATLRHRGGDVRKKKVSVDRVRRAAKKRGRLRVRLGRKGGAKGGKVTVVTGGDKSTTPDTTAPETSIVSGPADGSSTESTSASFKLAGDDAGGVAGYECALDGGAWSSCGSPASYSGLKISGHTFSARAVDKAGNVDATPSTVSWTVTTQGQVYTAPGSIPTGCSTDATSQILSWIASVPNNSTINFAPGACYRIEGVLELKSRDLTIDGNGATFKSLNAPTDQRALWRFWDSDVIVRNMTVVGSYANGGVHTDSLQHAHAIDLRGTRAMVENLTMSDLAGDCVYFGLGATRSSGVVRDSSCKRISRNAVSVVAGDNVLAERMVTDQIGYITFDVEPNTGGANGSTNATFDSNTIGSYYMKAYTIIGNAPVSNQRFTNNRVVGQGLRIGIVNKSNRPQNVQISGNSSDTPTGNNAFGIDGVDNLSVSGNVVPLTSGTMAQVGYSCNVSVSGNSFPGGSNEVSIVQPAC